MARSVKVAREAYVAGRIDEAIGLLDREAVEAGANKDAQKLVEVVRAAEEMKRTSRIDAQRGFDDVIRLARGLQRQVAAGEPPDPDRARSPIPRKEPQFVPWVSACVAMFGAAAALSALWGIAVFVDTVRDGDRGEAVSLLFLGLLAAAVWIGFAVALVMLRQIALAGGDEAEEWKAKARQAGDAIASPGEREHFDEDYATL